MGQLADSNRTPLGLHRIAEKIGGGWPIGAVFRSRRLVGFTWRGLPDAAIAHRILWLEGLEPGFNRGGRVDSYQRYIYIHGIGNEPTLGRPASRGCIHLAAADLLPLYDRVPVGTLVWITGRTPAPLQAMSEFAVRARVCDPQRLDFEAAVLRLTEPRSEIRTPPNFTAD
ncbi:MAG: L,D-transpeptidase [Verrucomicrobia bacterium]|nr:L,D-transpeptidase [Verrucomicrobiota bacterium]